jgi:hypothetical protein
LFHFNFDKCAIQENSGKQDSCKHLNSWLSYKSSVHYLSNNVGHLQHAFLRLIPKHFKKLSCLPVFSWIAHLSKLKWNKLFKGLIHLTIQIYYFFYKKRALMVKKFVTVYMYKSRWTQDANVKYGLLKKIMLIKLVLLYL